MENNNDPSYRKDDASTNSNPTYTTGNSDLFKQGKPNLNKEAVPNGNGAPNGYNNPNMYNKQNGYNNPNMQGGPNPYGNPNMQGGPNGYGNPNGYYSPYKPNKPKSNGFATASLVLGIISLFGALCYGLPGVLFGLPAIILAFISKNRQPENNDKMSGVAVGGLITGIIGFILGCMVFGLVIYVVCHLNDPSSIWYTFGRELSTYKY